ncbi:uncharacterized protein LOC103987037 [Musa acuminata AAA Group]|uniref:uncharacterized protein LOC103987037 n=1 Tax=Musa acuminata AAA Group TaxID=214697 RepID=UPI0031D61B53
MESSSAAKKLWHIVRVVFYMHRKSLSMHKLMVDLHLLLKRGKNTGKALGHLVTFHHHGHLHGVAAMYSGFSCRSMDPDRAFYSPREVEFSCSSTPSYPSLHAIRRRNRHRRYDYDYDAVAVATAFETLDFEISDAESVVPSPSPAGARQLRITDSPFPLTEDEEAAYQHIDQEAEEFIRRFYEQLRLQQRIPVTPEYSHHRHEPLMGRA